jgi:regulator of replication initiation timing
MERRKLFGHVEDIEEQVGILYQQLGELKRQIKILLEENHKLSLENHNLRELLHNKEQKEPSAPADTNQKRNKNLYIGEGHDNLARLYYEGFHICSQYYGSLRTEGDCLFCLSFLNKQG